MIKWFLPFLFLLTLKIYAIDFEDAIYPELATSSRALAMGNAFIAKVDDSSAVFYNPAGLGTVRYPHLHFSNFSFETNRGGIKGVTGGSGLDSFSNATKMFTIDGTREVMKNYVGEIAHSRIHALPNFTARYFSFGYLFAKRTRAVVLDLTSNTGFEFADRLDHGPYAALNLSLFGGIIKFGFSSIYLSRKEIISTADPNATITLSAASYNSGTALVSTGGARITLPISFLPTLAATMHNVLGAEFSAASGGAGAPTKIPSSIDVGFSITPQIGTATRVHLEANYKDITGQFSGVTATRKMLLGMELDFSRVFFFRVGYGDGFGSAGLGVRTKKVEFDLTTYAVDTTSSAWRGNEDRRFVIGLSSGF